MAEGPDRRCRIGVVGWDRTVGIDAKNLAAQRRPVLRQWRIAALPRRDVELAVRTERDASAVWTEPAGMPVRIGDCSVSAPPS